MGRKHIQNVKPTFYFYRKKEGLIISSRVSERSLTNFESVDRYKLLYGNYIK